MIKIDNLKLNKNNKDILEKYQIYLLTVKQKEEKTTVSSYIEDIYKYLEYMENNKIKTAVCTLVLGSCHTEEDPQHPCP